MNAKEAAKAEAVARLREWIKPGDTVYTILRHVSRSGMSRDVSVVLIQPDGVTLHPNHAVATATGNPLRSGWTDAVRMSGCGMDMGFALVYSLARSLFPDGFGCIGQGCPSNDHSNGDRDFTPHKGGAASCQDAKDGCQGPVHWHRDGGYALRQRWL